LYNCALMSEGSFVRNRTRPFSDRDISLGGHSPIVLPNAEPEAQGYDANGKNLN
jgi:hypothetical protein